jgi:hypothetical protein
MRIALALTAALLLALPMSAAAQNTTLADASAALGATSLKSLEYSGSGVLFQAGQSASPGQPWPRFNAKSYTRAVNYETASLRDDVVRTQGENPPRGGGVQPVLGEQRQLFLLSGDHAWNLVADAAVPAPWPSGDGSCGPHRTGS